MTRADAITLPHNGIVPICRHVLIPAWTKCIREESRIQIMTKTQPPIVDSTRSYSSGAPCSNESGN